MCPTVLWLSRTISFYFDRLLLVHLIELHLSRLALKIVVMARQEARVKRVWAILRFFTQFGFIVFTYLLLEIRSNI